MCLRHYAENKPTLNKAVKALETKAQAELHARIEIAKADSNKQGVTINTGK